MDKILISSRKNQIIKSASALLTSSEERKNTSTFLVEGARLTMDAALSGTKILRLFYTENAYSKYKEYIEKAEKIANEVYIVEPHVATLLSSTKTNQGVFALCKKSEFEFANNEIKGKILVLENIQDPSNMGAILRTAEALGIKKILLSGDCCDIYSPKALRASMGAVFRGEFIFGKNPDETGKILKSNKYLIYGSVPLSTATKITEINFCDNSAVVIGNEGNGMSEEMKNICDDLVTIPMLGRAESLNAATAASIIMWEMVK